jgi:transcriptional regulator with PAS, ATPase and Fis domain
MRELVATAAKIADRDVPVLILGESGCGKDHLAEILHACSSRLEQPFVHVECASIPADLFESELFGHERGTFTGASARKPGKLELARRGTVYFDEIAALAPSLQAKLLRAIQERRFSRLGGAEVIPFDARVLTSSNADLAALLASGALRRDLYYRINVVTLRIPPLRERTEDILPLARQFLRRRKKGFTAAAERLLAGHAWPGNVRELRNAIERAVLVEEGERIDAPSLGIHAADDLVHAAARGGWTLGELESHYIREVLRATQSNFSRAAEILGINRKTLREKRRKYGLP